MKRNPKFVFFVIFFLLFGFALNIFAQKERYVFPFDEGKTDASFNAFREKLIKAVKNKDKKFLLGVLDRNIEVSFGGDAGIADFRRFWKLDSANSRLWNELLIVLTNGGNFSDGKRQFSAPYTFTNFPEDLDIFEYQAIFGSNVNLRAEPNLSSKIIAQLSYNVVKVDHENSVPDKSREGEYIWYKVETLGGKKGFVSSQYVRSPIDYRAGFEKKNGKWLMTFFVAGD